VSVIFYKICNAAERLITEHLIFFFTREMKVSKILAGSQIVILEKITKTSFLAYWGTAEEFSIESSKAFYKEALPSISENLLTLSIYHCNLEK